MPLTDEISHKTFATIINYVSATNPSLLDGLFKGIDLKSKGLELKLSKDLSVPSHLIPYLRDQHALDCYVHYLGNLNLYGSLEDERLIFKNLVELSTDPLASFEVGRYAKSASSFSMLKAAFILFSANPNTAFKSGANTLNRRLNHVFDMNYIGGSDDYSIIDFDYFAPFKPQILGDLYTLGVIVAATESLDRKEVTISQLISPFDRKTEEMKQDLNQRGLKYTFDQCQFIPNSGVSRYKLSWRERKLGLGERVELVLREYNTRKQAARMGVQEKAYVTTAILVNQQEEKLDQTTMFALQAQTEAAEARAKVAEAQANALEAKLTLEQQVSGVNQAFTNARTLAHDNKNHALSLRADCITILGQALKLHPQYATSPALKNLFDDDQQLVSGIDNLLTTNSTPKELRPILEYTQDTLKRLGEMIENDRSIMAGGMPVNIQDLSYLVTLKPVVDPLRRIHPQINIQYEIDQDINLQGDERLLKVAFTNLIANAAEASYPRGTVTIIPTQKKRGNRTFTIIDINQSGYIPPDIADKLNNAESFTTKKEGNATGAQASYNIITGPHNGTIKYNSRDDGGQIRIII